MKKEQIVEVLEKIATLLELKDENPFKIRAYTNAARSIETWGGNVCATCATGNARENPRHRQSDRRENQGAWRHRFARSSSRNCARNFPPAFWNCFPSPASARKRSRRSTSNCRSARSRRSAARPAKAVAWRNCPGFGKTTQEKLGRCRSRIARNMPDHFQLGQIAAEAETVAGRSARIPLRRSMSASPEVIGGGRRSCATSISSSRRKRRKRSRNSSSSIRWSNRSSRKARRKRACGCVPASNAICAW